MSYYVDNSDVPSDEDVTGYYIMWLSTLGEAGNVAKESRLEDTREGGKRGSGGSNGDDGAAGNCGGYDRDCGNLCGVCGGYGDDPRAWWRGGGCGGVRTVIAAQAEMTRVAETLVLGARTVAYD